MPDACDRVEASKLRTYTNDAAPIKVSALNAALRTFSLQGWQAACAMQRARASAPRRSCLRLANAPEHNIATIAFPALSCGAYGYPVAEAADIAVRTCQDEAGRLEVVDFVLFTKRTFDSFDAASQRFLQPSS